jgi:hypothetical protein
MTLEALGLTTATFLTGEEAIADIVDAELACKCA